MSKREVMKRAFYEMSIAATKLPIADAEHLHRVCREIRAELAKPEPQTIAWLFDNPSLSSGALNFEYRELGQGWTAHELCRKEDV